MKKLLLIALPFFCFIPVAKAEEDVTAIKRLVNQWNDVHQSGRVVELRDLYNYTVLFYGQYISREQCVKNKKAIIQGQYSQKIDSSIKITYYTSGTIQCSFTKEINHEGGTKKYPAYLLLEKRGNKYIITGESDLITDQNQHFQLNLGQEARPPSRNTSFLLIVIAIIAIVVILGIGYLAFRRKKTFVRSERPITVYVAPKKVMTKTVPTSKSALAIAEVEKKRSPFEEFVIEKFDQANFEILEYQNEKYQDGRSVQITRHPDEEVRLRHKHSNIVFAVECKWRKNLYNDKVVWAKPHQWDSFNDFEQTTGNPVFIAIGIGGDPGRPENVFILPLKKIYSTELSIFQLNQYKSNGNGHFLFDPENRTLS